MPDHSPRLDLPYVQPAQAQKHVTVNEAFERLDALTQLVVQSFGAETPPPAPDVGKIWALGPNPTGAWTSQGNHLAIATQGNGWLFILPMDGWSAWGLAESELRTYGGTTWAATVAPPARLEQLGIATDANATNRLAVVSPASLFSHAGAGHQVKINKAGPTDTASLLYQTNWTGHAELGLAGDNDLSIKVSADGTTWKEALKIAGGAGTVTGTAVQADALDVTSGRLLAAGAFGLGTGVALPSNNIDQATKGGCYTGFGGSHGSASAGANPFGTSTGTFCVQVLRGTDDAQQWAQVAVETGATPRLRLRTRANSAGTASAWTDVVTSASAVGPVASGGIVESGNNANGRYVRYADGTQICTIKRLELTHRSVADCFAAWSFPIAFSETGALTVQANLLPATDAADASTAASAAAPLASGLGAPIHGTLTTTSVGVAVHRITGTTNFVASDKLYVSVTATGRWS